MAADADATLPLLSAAKRLQALPHLPPYATDLVRACVRSVRDRDALVCGILDAYASQGSQSSAAGFNPADDPATACRLLVEHLTMRRHKRVLLAYHAARLRAIEAVVWAGKEDEEFGSGAGAAGAADTPAAAAEGRLSPEEEDHVRQYSAVLAAYKGKWTDIDLAGSLEPPGDLFIDVRCLKDAGEVQTEYGSINLTKNSQYFVRASDVERLIAQGYLQRLS